MNNPLLIVSTNIALLVCSACSNSPGRPVAGSEVTAPNQIVDFNALFGQNCSGCHGPSGKQGEAVSLADPVFLAIANDPVIRTFVTYGVPGTPMPAWGQSAGGPLTREQIDVLVKGIRSWAKPETLQGTTVPSYSAKSAGDPQHGAGVYQTYCSSCHGLDGRGGKASSIVDTSYLALVSNQDLRLSVIMGQPWLGAPDWRGDVPGRPLAEQEITDVVSWLASQRSPSPGQPYPTSYKVEGTGGVQ
jgi:cytochrome c oxidase cbb3-type subunit III